MIYYSFSNEFVQLRGGLFIRKLRLMKAEMQSIFICLNYRVHKRGEQKTSVNQTVAKLQKVRKGRATFLARIKILFLEELW